MSEHELREVDYRIAREVFGWSAEEVDAVRRRFLAAGGSAVNRDPVLRRAYRRLAGSLAARGA